MTEREELRGLLYNSYSESARLSFESSSLKVSKRAFPWHPTPEITFPHARGAKGLRTPLPLATSHYDGGAAG
eukprot:scaffold27627_cov101-Isochrysis_galbana.AAC.1